MPLFKMRWIQAVVFKMTAVQLMIVLCVGVPICLPALSLPNYATYWQRQSGARNFLKDFFYHFIASFQSVSTKSISIFGYLPCLKVWNLLSCYFMNIRTDIFLFILISVVSQALGGGNLHPGHYEMMRIGINKKIDESRMFAVWRIPAPWKPVTRKGAGHKMGGGKGSIDHYVTPVRAGRIIIELGGACEYGEVFLMLVSCAFHVGNNETGPNFHLLCSSLDYKLRRNYGIIAFGGFSCDYNWVNVWVVQCEQGIKVKKVKFSDTHYQVLGPELIPVYRQSACRWLLKSSRR